MDIHNVAIIKRAAEIFDTNPLRKHITDVHNTAVATVELEPFIEEIRTGESNTDEPMWISPTDKDFYLLGFQISVAGGLGSGSIRLTAANGVSAYFKYNNGDCDSLSFGKRGIKLLRGSSIDIVNVDADNTAVAIWGYYDSRGEPSV